MFVFDSKVLTIAETDLNNQEQRDFKSLVCLGDSENMALWTIEHMIRPKKDSHSEYAQAYNY